MAKLCRKLWAQECKIVEMAEKYAMTGIRHDYNADELHTLRFPEHPELLPLNVRLDRYTNAVEGGNWRDSVLAEGAPDLRKPLAFFGSYVSLNSLD